MDNIISVGPIRPGTVFPLETDKPSKGPDGFGDMLKAAIGEVNTQLTAADDQLQKLALGEVQNVHEVMVAMQKADLSLTLVAEIRDRALEAYQTIMRMAL